MALSMAVWRAGWIVAEDQRALNLGEGDPEVARDHLETDVDDELVEADLGVAALPHGHVGGLADPAMSS